MNMKYEILIVISAFAFTGCCSTRNTERPLNGSAAAIPECINKLIVQYKSEPKQNPPRSIYSYTYSEKTVYYVPAICCDQYSDLYDGDCNMIAHPDGGLTGNGDGRLPDFIKTKTMEKLLWHDERK
ncbi:MAG: hypothetical protein ABIT07_03920 [Ferruginibacter sp.]